MDLRVKRCRDLTEEDKALLGRIEAGMWLTADVSRADMQLWCLIAPDRALIAQHAMPKSISSIYREERTGRLMRPGEHPQLFRALRHGQGSRNQPEIVSSGAPVMQDIYPIYNPQKRIIGAMVIETNMIAHERQRRRHGSFQRAVPGLQEMCMRGELASAAGLSRFSLYDGVYLVDRNRYVLYMSGIAVNLFRSIRIAVNIHEQKLSGLEDIDEDLVSETFRTGECFEHRDETADGRVWVRKVIPVRMPFTTVATLRFRFPWLTLYAPHNRTGMDTGERSRRSVDAALMLMHNATEAVEKQRELNVKSALIQEVHHRVKNNLQNVAAILRMQARRSDSEDARQHLIDAVNRILSVSVIHEFLSEDEHRLINIRDLSQRIAQQITQVASGPDQAIDIRITGPNIRLPAGQATPVAMVLNELVLNAVEHGVHGENEGQIEIALHDLGNAVRMVISNNGRGLPSNFDLAQSKSLGLQIVRTLVDDDLKGKLLIQPVPVALETGNQDAGEQDTEKPGNIHPETDRDALPPIQRGNEEVNAKPTANGGAPVRYGTQAVVTFPKRALNVD